MAEHARKLPRGRHGLAREAVAASQSGRLQESVLLAVAEHGYHGATVAHIVRGARVSRETFYEHYASKSECFGAGLEATAGDLSAVLAEALDGEGDPLELCDAFLHVCLAWFAAHPQVGRCHLLELRYAGAEAIRAGDRRAGRLVTRLMEVVGTEDRFACEMFVAGTLRLIQARLEAGEARSLPDLREPLMQTVRQYLAADPLVASA